MKNKYCLIFAIVICPVLLAIDGTSVIEHYHVVVDSKSDHAYGSLITGNGDVGANVWVEKNGDLMFYLSKTDSYSENGRLLKLGRVRVHFEPNPFADGLPFQKILRLADSEIQIRAGKDSEQIDIRFWIDAHHPIVHIETKSEQPCAVNVTLETWRNEKKLLENLTVGDLYRLSDHQTWVYPDTVEFDKNENALYWYHYNEHSAWPTTMEHQFLEAYMDKMTDPLLNRIFGGVIWGDTLKAGSGQTLKSVKPTKQCDFQIAVLTKHPSNPENWRKHLNKIRKSTDSANIEIDRKNHRQWWQNFWDKSWIHITGAEDGRKVAMGYQCQRYVHACGGRGELPIKFNGSIFTVDDPGAGQNDPDWRNWGPGHWFQNLRLPYWSMLRAGDYEMMKPLFDMYLNNLELSKFRTKLFYQHKGVHFPEMMYFFGATFNELYSWDKQGKEPNSVSWRLYIEGGLELSQMMLEYYRHTKDEAFLKKYVYPITIPIIEFYDLHYPRTKQRQLRIEPALALETYTDCTNPMPAVAGLHAVIQGLLDLPSELTPAKERQRWQRLYDILPPLPTQEIDGIQMYAPADKFRATGHWEMPQMHCVFPYRLKGLGKPDLQMVCGAFANRLHKGGWGWEQDDIMMAYLGLVDQAKANIVKRATNVQAGSIFPAFWIHNLNWAPCQDHGSVLMVALQRMLLQANGNTILLMPCWPKDWNVNFKLHTRDNTTVQANYTSGQFELLEVVPANRRNDLVIWNQPCDMPQKRENK